MNYLRHIFDYLPCIFIFLREVFYREKKYFFHAKQILYRTASLPVFCRTVPHHWLQYRPQRRFERNKKPQHPFHNAVHLIFVL